MEYNITYRKKDKGWQYIITVKKDGKWKHAGSKQGFKTRALAKVAAEKRVDEMKEKAEVQKEALPEHQDLTFKEFKDMYINHKELYAVKGTINNIKNATSHLDILNDMPMTDILSYHIQNCTDNMVKKGLLPPTIQMYLTNIKTLFNAAIDPYKIIAENPVNNILIPQDKRDGKVKALTKAELNDLLSKISNPKHYIASLLAAKCGLRLGEIVGLTWDRVDTKGAQIIINRQWKLLDDGEWGFGEVKSKNSNRTVPAPPIVIAELEKYKKMYPIHISNRIVPYVYTNTLSSILSNKYHKAGHKDTTAHDLRHTYGTMLIAHGLDFKTVAELMGHDVKETIKTYTHVTDDMRIKATNLINSIF